MNTSNNKIVLSTGLEITVLTATRSLGIQRAVLITEADEKWIGVNTDSLKDKLKKYDETMLYPSLVACSQTNELIVPTFEEFENMLEVDSNLWISKVKEINSHWLPAETINTPEAISEEQEKNA